MDTYLTANQNNNRGYVFDGYFYTQEACFSVLNANNYEQALQYLDGVKKICMEFPWLNDVIIASKAAAAARFSRSQEELAFRTAFLQRQHLLFEPEKML